MSKVKPIGTIGKLLFKAIYPFGSKKASNIFKDGTFGDKLATGGVEAIDKSVDVLSDNDAENSKQLNEVWVGYLKETVLPAVGDEIAPVLDSIAKPAFQALLTSLARKIVESTYLFLDDIKDNPAQLKAFAEEYFKGDEFRGLVMDEVKELVEAKIKDEALQGFFFAAAEGLLDLLQDKDPSNAREFVGA